MSTGACYWSGNGSYCCPCSGKGQADVAEASSTSCLECGHPLRSHFIIGPHPDNSIGSQVFLPRHETVRELANRIREQRVVLARGTPSSGKTFLAWSLHTYLCGQGVKPIYIRNFPLSLEGGPTALHHLVEACHMQGFAAFEHSILHDNFVFLIDDAHTTYNNSELWLILNSVNQDRLANIPGISFCMFSAFGTPDRGVMPHNMGSDLLIFDKSQRLVLSEHYYYFTQKITLFYTSEEFNLYVEMHLESRDSDYDIGEALKRRILALTGGHPELVDAFMHLCDLWYEAWYKDDDFDVIEHDDDEVSKFVQIPGILEGAIAAIVNFAGLPLSPETFFPPEQEFEVLRQVQRSRFEGMFFDPRSEAMLSCITKGWLHMEESLEGVFKCYFPTRFHDRLVGYLMGVQELRYPLPPTLNIAELELMMSMRNMTIS
ncbi:unnamed protein product [Penicillium nalgiovense]|nr:unnamed protein product [Penicillium nalgiovense]